MNFRIIRNFAAAVVLGGGLGAAGAGVAATVPIGGQSATVGGATSTSMLHLAQAQQRRAQRRAQRRQMRRQQRRMNRRQMRRMERRRARRMERRQQRRMNRRQMRRQDRRALRRAWRRGGYRRGVHGPRYRYRRTGYPYYHKGFYYAFPFWLGIAAAAAANAGDGNWERHVAWCHDRYRSYEPRYNRYTGYDGDYHKCRSPYWSG